MKKLCFFTSARSEYGLIKWLMKDVDGSSDFELQLVVTGAHLLKEQGYTIDNIRQDGFEISAVVDSGLNTGSPADIAASMGRMAERIAPILSELSPDYIVVLGDRYELLPICNTAYVMRIPIIHISGGDVTKGAIDDGIRNAVTMISEYHFPGTKESADNIIRMRGSEENVWSVGEPGLDSFNRESLMTREDVAESLKLDTNSKWVLMTYHAETKKSNEYNIEAVRACCRALNDLSGFQTVITYANADLCGDKINEYVRSYALASSDRVIVIPSLGNRRYLSLMKNVEFVIGNSSSGIIEAPFLGKHVINVGDRQKGRHLCSNIVQSKTDYASIRKAIEYVMKNDVDTSDTDYWGDGHTSSRILKVLKQALK